MLNRDMLDTLKGLILTATTEDDRAAFDTASAEDQVAVLTELVEDRKKLLPPITPEQIGAFVLLFRVKKGLVAPGSAEHLALRQTLTGRAAISRWPKANPPVRSIVEFYNAARVPSWSAELEAANRAARNISFGIASSVSAIAAEIRHELDIGGLEDTMDPEALPDTDPTMKLLVDYVIGSALTVARGEWFDATGNLLTALPEGVSGESLSSIETKAKIKEQADRDERRRLKALEKQAQEKAEMAATHRLVAESVEGNPAVKAVLIAEVDRLAAMAFEDASESDVEASPALLESLFPGQERTPKVQEWAVDGLAQYVYAELAKKNPVWFRPSRDGVSLTWRRSIKSLVAPRPNTRAQNAIANALNTIVSKYGVDQLAIGLRRFGLPDTVELVAAPDGAAAVDG